MNDIHHLPGKAEAKAVIRQHRKASFYVKKYLMIFMGAMIAGSILIDREENRAVVRVESLSPSSADHQRMASVFAGKKAELLEADFRQTVPSLHPNLGSVVLRIEVGTRRILLGADMEHRKSEDSGWNAILESSNLRDEADYYKNAHHGSKTGDVPEIWSKLLISECTSVLAPNQRLANPLPKHSCHHRQS